MGRGLPPWGYPCPISTTVAPELSGDSKSRAEGLDFVDAFVFLERGAFFPGHWRNWCRNVDEEIVGSWSVDVDVVGLSSQAGFCLQAGSFRIFSNSHSMYIICSPRAPGLFRPLTIRWSVNLCFGNEQSPFFHKFWLDSPRGSRRLEESSGGSLFLK